MTRKSVTDEQYGQLCRRLDEVKRRIVEGTLPFKPMMGLLQTIIEGRVTKQLETVGFPITVDYTKTLAEMIKAGKYDWVNDIITHERFPVKGRGWQETEVVLFHFGKKMATNRIITEMDKEGFRPANIAELLALGASQPELQKQFSIVAFGSVWQDPLGRRCVGRLSCCNAKRYLDLCWFDNDWFEHERFATVHKKE